MLGCDCCIITSAIVAVIAFKTIRFVLEKVLQVNPKGKVVYVTGCDSGFGKETADRLFASGFTVVAACFTKEGRQYFEKRGDDRLMTVELDVSSDTSIEKAANFVKSKCEGRGLYGVVNNAGVAFMGDVFLSTPDVYRNTLNVNALGVALVTKSVLHLLAQAHGRIVNVASVAGRIGVAGMGHYSMSKFAVEAFSDACRVELRPFNIKVSVIEPGFFRTPLVGGKKLTNDFLAMVKRNPQEIQDMYGDKCLQQTCQTLLANVDTFADPDPGKVATVMVESLKTKLPRTRYLVGNDAIFVWQWVARLPNRVQDFLIATFIAKMPPLGKPVQKAPLA